MQNSNSPNIRKSSLAQLVPVLLCFFAMGFVDLVGTASNYVQKDLQLTDAQANIFPSLVFFWFLIFSVPTSLLMNKIGRKNTVLLSLSITALSLIIPIFGSGYYIMLLAFSFLGIGNAIMQTSLNPLVSNLISPNRLAATLTFGQFVKAIASFLAPIIASWGAVTASTTFGLGWKVLFPIYALISILSVIMLGVTKIKEETPDKGAGIKECLRLLATPAILLCFLGIMCHVGIDVGTNTMAPKLIMERLGAPLEEAVYATTVYFIARTIGCLSGSIILQRIKARTFFAISVAMMILAMVLMFCGTSVAILYTAMALVGFGNSNIFSIVFSQALFAAPTHKNEVSGLMIMGLFGGTIFPIAMGFMSDALASQAGAVAVLSIGVAYLIFYTLKIRK